MSLLVLGLFGIAERRFAGGSGFPFDDAWIHAVFARNLATGEGMAFNAGVPVAGSTAPLWTYILGIVYGATGNMLVAAKVSGGILYVLANVLVLALARQCTSCRRDAVVVATLAAMTGWHAFGGLSGMEMPLYVALAIAGLLLHIASGYGRAGYWALASTLVLALSALARPECLSLLVATRLDAITGGFRQWPKRSEWTQHLGWTSAHIAIAVAALWPTALFNLRSNGTVLPATFEVKAGEHLLGTAMTKGFFQAARTAVGGVALGVIAFLAKVFVENPVLALGAMPLFRVARGRTLPAPQRRCLSFLAGAILVSVVLLGLADPGTQVPYRYATHIFVLMVALGAMGWLTLEASLDPRRLVSLAGVCALAAAVGLVILGRFAGAGAPLPEQFPYQLGAAPDAPALGPGFLGMIGVALVGAARLVPARRLQVAILCLALACTVCRLAGMAEYHGRSVATINALHVACGNWLARETPPNAIVGADDVGAVGFFSERRIVDTIGLITPAVARARRAGKPLGPILQASGVDYVATLRPRTLPDLGEMTSPIYTSSLTPSVGAVNDSIYVVRTTW